MTAVAETGGILAGARRAGLVVFAIRVAGAGLAYAMQVLLARWLGQAGYGIFASLWIWIAILGHGSLLGIGQAVYRFVPHHRALGEAALARGFLAGGTVAVLASALAVAGAGALALAALHRELDPVFGGAAVVALAILPLFALHDYTEGVARAFHWSALAIAPPYLLRPALAIAVVLAFADAGLPADPAVAMVALLAAVATGLALQGGLILCRLPAALPPGPRAYRARAWGGVALPIALVDLTALLATYADVLILSLLLPPEAVAVYFAATRIVQFVNFVPYAASAVSAGRFAEAGARGDRAGLAELARRTARLTTLASLAVGAALVAVAPLMLAGFGPGFAASWPALAILVVGIVAASAFGPGEDVLTMLGGERLCALVALAALAAAVILALALVPAFGLVGAALATAAAGVLRAAALALAARRHLGVATHVLG